MWGGEDGGGGVTWETPGMEVTGQLISEPLTCADRKLRQRMAELQERRRSLQALLSSRLAELRRICLQEAELTGAVPGGGETPCVRRRGVASRQGNRKGRSEEEDSQRSKLKKTLFSAALRKHSESDNTHHGKRTVHRGCHTDDTVRSESSSTSDSTGLDNDDAVCRPPETFYLNKTRSSRHRAELHDHPPQDSPEGGGVLLECLTPPSRMHCGEGAGQRGGFSEELLDYVWGKQQRPITAQQLYGAPPTYRHHQGDQRRIKVTRTKSCGPFLPSDTHNAPLPAIQPDPQPHLLPPRPPQSPPHPHLLPPHPHLLPPRPPQSPPDAHLEDATRSLHKALALEGLRDWYLRNTLGPAQQNQVKVNGGVKGQGGGRHRVIQQPTNQKKALPHSATFSGQTLHTRCADSALLRAPPPQQERPSPGTLFLVITGYYLLYELQVKVELQVCNDRLQLQVCNYWLQLQVCNDWLQLQVCNYWLQLQVCNDWLQVKVELQVCNDWLQVKVCNDRLQLQVCNDWLQVKVCNDWLQVKVELQVCNDWLQLQVCNDWLQVKVELHVCNDWLQVKVCNDWLQVKVCNDWLQLQVYNDGLQVKVCNDGLQVKVELQVCNDGLQVKVCNDWLQVKVCNDWLQVKVCNDGLQVKVCNDGLQVKVCNDGLQVKVCNDWLQLQVYNDGLQLQVYNDGLQVKVCNDGLQVKVCNDGLQVKVCNDWLQLQVYNDWLQLQVYNDGLQVKVCNDGLQVKVCNDGLQVKVCNDWLQVKVCNDWLQVKVCVMISVFLSEQ
ncbi:hypothetical protein NQZ68_039257 [Dissostichus eleginoides]|nr:hypothetical protein NQZ68_039257 [Dissostichus eleginoides]